MAQPVTKGGFYNRCPLPSLPNPPPFFLSSLSPTPFDADTLEKRVRGSGRVEYAVEDSSF